MPSVRRTKTGEISVTPKKRGERRMSVRQVERYFEENYRQSCLAEGIDVPADQATFVRRHKAGNAAKTRLKRV